MQVSTTWALTCPGTVHQRPCITREIETWPSDNRVGSNSVVDHRSRRPVLSPLRNCVDSLDVLSDHIGRRDASRGGGTKNGPRSSRPSHELNCTEMN